MELFVWGGGGGGLGGEALLSLKFFMVDPFSSGRRPIFYESLPG